MDLDDILDGLRADRSLGASEFSGMTAQAVTAMYRKRVLCARALGFLDIALFAALAFWSIGAHQLLLYFVSVAGIFAPALVARPFINRLFERTLDIINRDCDTAKFRGFLEQMASRAILGRTKRQAACYLAVCDTFDTRWADALERLGGISFGKRSPMRFQLINTRLLSYQALGMTDKAAAALEDMRRMHGDMRKGTAIEQLMRRSIGVAELRLRDVESWNEEDAAFLLACGREARNHRERVEFALAIARYLVARGDAEDARTLLDLNLLGPIAPNAEHVRAELASRVARACPRSISA